MGTPIIATDVGAARELLDSGQCGQLIPPRAPAVIADALRRYAEDRDLRMKHGAAARGSCKRTVHYSPNG